METSDHWPCIVEVKTAIPKGKVFRFENFWMSHPEFLTLVTSSWNAPYPQQDAAKLLTAKFKALRNNLKRWQAQLSNMKKTIANVKLVISFLDSFEEWRDLALHKWNFREILNQKLASLLHQQMVYWKQRGNIKWVQLGDENSKIFHANATLRHRRNLITSLSDHSKNLVHDHSLKADLIKNDFKERLETSNFEHMLFDWVDDGRHLSRLLVQARVVDFESIPQFLVLTEGEGF